MLSEPCSTDLSHANALPLEPRTLMSSASKESRCTALKGSAEALLTSTKPSGTMQREHGVPACLRVEQTGAGAAC